jgi:hypothetical protein
MRTRRLPAKTISILFSGLILIACSPRAAVSRSVENTVTLVAPYPAVQSEGSPDKISVQNAVREIAQQAGLDYNFETSFENTNPICRRFIEPEIRGKSLQEALEMILGPLGLTYTIAAGKIVLDRLPPDSSRNNEILWKGTQHSAERIDANARAAERGDADSQWHLGLGYYNHKNYAEARLWFERSAEKGQREAQLFLGRFYYEGLGVAQDYVQAYMWFDLSRVASVGAELDVAEYWQEEAVKHLKPQ